MQCRVCNYKENEMQVQKIQNNTCYNPQFNGRFCMYNYHKNRWFVKSTTPKEDKILLQLFDSFPLKFNSRGAYNSYSRMKYSDLLRYIESFPKTSKGINLPKPSEECSTYVEYYNDPVGPDSSYEIETKGVFRIRHSFNKAEIRDVED